MVKKIFISFVVLLVIFAAVQIINASKYAMTVNVVEGENVVGLNPTAERLDFGDLSRNNGMVRRVALENGGNFDIFVAAFQFGELAELSELNRNFFILAPGEETQLEFEVSIPPSAETRKYNGNVWVFRIPKPI